MDYFLLCITALCTDECLTSSLSSTQETSGMPLPTPMLWQLLKRLDPEKSTLENYLQLKKYHYVNSRINENHGTGSQFYSGTTVWWQGEGLWWPQREMVLPGIRTLWQLEPKEPSYGIFKMLNAYARIHFPFHFPQTDWEPAAVVGTAISWGTHHWVVRLQDCQVAQNRAWCHCHCSHHQQWVRATEALTVTQETGGAASKFLRHFEMRVAADISDWALVENQVFISRCDGAEERQCWGKGAEVFCTELWTWVTAF